jgi:hypothetical protein
MIATVTPRARASAQVQVVLQQSAQQRAALDLQAVLRLGVGQ